MFINIIFVNAIRSMDFVGKYALSTPIINLNFEVIKHMQKSFITLADYFLFLNATEERRKKRKRTNKFHRQANLKNN